MKKLDILSGKDQKFDDSFVIKLDCNNDIGILYLREQDSTCFFKDRSRTYQLPKEDYDFILEKIGK